MIVLTAQLVGISDVVALFALFVVNAWTILFRLVRRVRARPVVQYRARGRWWHYLFGERSDILLSLAAKAALAGHVFADTLATTRSTRSSSCFLRIRTHVASFM